MKIGASMSNSYDKENKNPAAFMGTGVVIMQILDDKFEYDLYKGWGLGAKYKTTEVEFGNVKFDIDSTIVYLNKRF